MGDDGGGVDLISSLSDELLVRILELVPDARAVVRTDALSRRWRGLWTGVAALRFDSDSWPVFYGEVGVAEHYLAFVDDVLTLRAKATTTRCHGGVKDLEISFDMSVSDHITEEPPVSPSFKAAQGWFKAAQGWIRYAAQHEVKTLVLRLNLLWSYKAEDFLLKPYVAENDDENVDYDEDYYDENMDYDEGNYDENVDYDEGNYDKNVDYDEDYDENVDYDEDYDENVYYDEDYDENVDYYEDYDESVDYDDEDYRIPVMALDDLAASPAKLETMHLRLSGAKLHLPCSSSTVVFSSLADVSLKDVIVPCHLLSRLVSPPCCPRLRKLHLDDLQLSTMEEQMEELLLEGDTLLELSLRQIRNMQSLELRTPSLQVLHVENCLYLETFTVSAAPRLEDLMFEAYYPLRIIDVHDHLLSVGTLKIHLYSHGNCDGEDSNDTSIHLLQCCSLTKCLEVSLEVLEAIFQKGDIIKGWIPSLPHVTSLTVDITLWEPHTFGASIASFLAQCNNIRYLSLKFSYMNIKRDHHLCDNLCQWKSHEFSLVRLREAEFEWLIGTDCELQFIQSILKRKTGLQKVAISFTPWYWIKDNKDAFKLLPPLHGGSWTTCNNADLSYKYKWRRHCV